jgi:hypothetical protein
MKWTRSAIYDSTSKSIPHANMNTLADSIHRRAVFVTALFSKPNRKDELKPMYA